MISINKTFAVNGTATDPTSFTITVVRIDTGETLASAVAMTKISTGVYEYELTEPAANLLYTASFSVNYGGNVTTWSETINGSTTETIALPALTGDYLVDTLNSLLAERLEISRSGPRPSYNLHSHAVSWNEYVLYLDRRIRELRKEIAQTNPVEEMGFGI